MILPEMEILKKNLLFRTMDEDEITEVVNTLKPYTRTFDKKQIIAHDGDILDSMAIILSGKVYLSHIDPEGNSNLLEVLGEGDTMGMLNAVGRYRLHISAFAMERTEALFFDVGPLLRENVLTAPVQVRLLQNLTMALAQKAHRLTVRLEDSIRRSTRQKLQDYLSSEYHKAGDSLVFSIPLNRQDLADFLFVDRSAMSSELCRMRDEGLIKFDKSRFELLVEMPITDEEKDPNDRTD